MTCADCLQRTVNQTTEWSHRIVVASTVGPIRRFVLAWEAVHPRDGDAKQEGEQTGAYRLLDTPFRQYHHSVDIVVTDALYASRVFIEAVLQHGWDAIIRLKDDQRLAILRDAQGLKKISKPVQVVKVERGQVTLWDFLDLGWDHIGHLRIIAWERVVARSRRGRRHQGQWVTTTQTGWLLTTLGSQLGMVQTVNRPDMKMCGHPLVFASKAHKCRRRLQSPRRRSGPPRPAYAPRVPYTMLRT